MIKFNKRLIAGAVALFLILGMVAIPGTYVPADEQDIQDAQNEANQIQQNINELKNDLNSLKSDINNINSYMTSLDTKLDSYSQKIADYQQKANAKQAEIDAKNQEIKDKEADITNKQGELEEAKATEAKQYEDMKLRIQYMYENGGESYLNMIFESKNMAEFLNKAEYVSSISAYDREQLEQYASTKQQITDLLASLETEKVNLENQKSTLQTEKTELDSILAGVKEQQEYVNVVLNEKQSSLERLQSQQVSNEEMLEAKKQDLASQQALIKKLQDDWAKQQAAAGGSAQADAETQKRLDEIGISGFAWPLPGYTTITSEYGMRDHPIYHYPKLHDGMDISGASVYGKPIVAAYDGTVTLAESYWGYGNCVIIDHGSGIQTLYAHASSLLVSAGQTVKKGQTIALVGSTGNSTGPHLHFSIVIGGNFVNPRDYLVFPK